MEIKDTDYDRFLDQNTAELESIGGDYRDGFWDGAFGLFHFLQKESAKRGGGE